MSALAEFEAIRQRRAYRSAFPPGLEHEFRAAQRRRFRIARTAMLLVFALLLGLGPGFLPMYAAAPAYATPLRVAGAAVALLFAWTAWFTFIAGGRERLTQILHAASVLVAVGAALLLRWLALHGGLQFDDSLVAVVMVAIAFFGGFGWKRIAVVVAGCMLFGSALEIAAGDGGAQTWLPVYALALFAAVAVAGVYTHEYLARAGWIARQYAALLARTDPLTGLSTRVEFNHVFASRVAQARRDGRQLAVMLLDVDHFKQVNDRHGHLFGDEVLRRVGALVLERVARRPLDLRVRFGGEEIAVLWYDVDINCLQRSVAELLEAIRRLPLHDPATGAPVVVTASAGLTWLCPQGAVDPLAILRRADALLYRAKREGRDCCIGEAFGEPRASRNIVALK